MYRLSQKLQHVVPLVRDRWRAFALQVRIVLATVWRYALWRTTFIAITGSCGKTTAKQQLAAILAPHGRLLSTNGSENTIWATTSILLRARPWHRYIVAEIGTSVPGNIRRMARVFRPDVAVELAVLLDHYAAFRTLDRVAEEKADLLRSLRPGGLAVLNADDPSVAAMSVPEGVRVVTFGRAAEADWQARDVNSAWPGRLSFTAVARGHAERIESQLVGEHFLPSVLAPVAVARELGVPAQFVAEVVRRVPPATARLYPVQLPSGATILRDDFKCSPHTLRVAFEAIRQATARRKILVLGDIADTPRSGRDRHRHAGRIAAEVFDVLVFVGDYGQYAVRSAVYVGFDPARAHAFLTMEECAAFLRAELGPSDLVLLAASTREHFARILFQVAGTIACHQVHCRKKLHCDVCPELGADAEAQKLRTVFLKHGLPPKGLSRAQR